MAPTKALLLPETTIERVPNEIWTGILKYSSHPSLNNGDRQSRRGIYQPRLSPMVSMTQVCSKFRRIALSTPSLWTYILLQVHGSVWQYPDVSLLSLWLERSQNEPLFIDLDIGEHHPDPQPEINQGLVILCSHIARWKTTIVNIKLELEPMYYPARNMLLWSLDGTAPKLQSLNVTIVPGQYDEPQELIPSSLWNDAPALRQLALTIEDATDDEGEENLFSGWTIEHSIPYHQLIHLRLQGSRLEFITAEDLDTVFASSANLVSCFIQGFVFDQTVAVPPEAGPVVLHHLQHLYLEAHAEYDDAVLLYLGQSLMAPSLLTLTTPSKSWDQGAYTRFINQSACPLEELHLINISPDPLDLAEWLSISPSLRVVHFDNISEGITDRELARQLTELDEATNQFVLGPNLDRLSFNAPLSLHDYDGSQVVILDVLKKRLCPPNGSTKTFTTLSIPLEKEEYFRVDLRELLVEPWSLKIIPNNGAFNVDNLWRIYGGDISCH